MDVCGMLQEVENNNISEELRFAALHDCETKWKTCGNHGGTKSHKYGVVVLMSFRNASQCAPLSFKRVSGATQSCIAQLSAFPVLWPLLRLNSVPLPLVCFLT